MDQRVFWDCPALETVVLPHSLTGISSSWNGAAFANCGALTVYYVGTQAEWDYVGCNLGEDVALRIVPVGTDVSTLIGASSNHTSASLTERKYYGANEVVLTSADNVQKTAQVFISAMDTYLSDVGAAAEKDATAIRSGKSYASHGALLKAADEASDQRFLTPDSNMPSDALEAAYEVAALYLDEYVSTGRDLGKIDMSADVVSINASIVNKIRNNLANHSIYRKVNGYTIDLNALEFMTASFGSMTVMKGSRSYTVLLCSKANEVASVLTGYIKQLKTWEQDALYEAMHSIFAELADVTGISSLTKSP